MTPCLEALKEWRPELRSCLDGALAAPVLKASVVDHLLVAGQSAASRMALLAQLRNKRFDLALNYMAARRQ